MGKCGWCLSDEDTSKNNVTIEREYNSFLQASPFEKDAVLFHVRKAFRSREVSHNGNHCHLMAQKMTSYYQARALGTRYQYSIPVRVLKRLATLQKCSEINNNKKKNQPTVMKMHQPYNSIHPKLYIKEFLAMFLLSSHYSGTTINEFVENERAQMGPVG